MSAVLPFGITYDLLMPTGGVATYLSYDQVIVELAKQIDGPALDDQTKAWVDQVNRSGAAYLTPAVLDGRWMARVSIGSETTERPDVAAVWAAICTAAEKIC